MISAISNAVAQVARIFANKSDGDNAIKIKQVKDCRDADRAMEAAEKHMLNTMSFLNNKISLKQFTYLHDKYSERFFKYN